MPGRQAPKGRYFLAGAILIIALIICNATLASSSGWARLAWNSFGYLCLFITFKIARFKASDIGLSKSRLASGLNYAALCIAVIAFTITTAFLINSRLFNDQRYNQDLAQALYAGLLLIPIKTVVFEELAFRGLLPALLKKFKNNQWLIAGLSSVLFGLWHVSSAPKSGDYSTLHGSDLTLVIVTFLITTGAGAFFYWLRKKSGSLLAPILVHWFINSFSVFIAALSWR